MAGRSRAVRHARNLRQLLRLERMLQKPMQKELRGSAFAAARGFATDGQRGMERAMFAHEENILSLIAAHYAKTAEVFGKMTMSTLKGIDAWEKKDYEDELFEQLMREFINSEGTRMIASDISDRTKSMIRRVIRDGQAEGLGIATISKAIRDKIGRHISPFRSHIIARTESHNAAGFSAEAAVESTGLTNIRRLWATAGDGRVRDAHEESDGQEVAVKEPFTFERDDGSVYQLMFPGDRNGPADGVIMCRCFVLYEPGE